MSKRTTYVCKDCGAVKTVPADYMGNPKCDKGRFHVMVEQKEPKPKKD